MPPMPKSEAPTAMTGHDVSYTQLDGVQCPVVYKVVGDENSVEEYDAACRRRRAATAPTPQAAAMSAEWHGLYTQTTVAHAAGTAGYRWDQGYREARVLELVLAPPPRLQLLRVMGAMMTDGAVAGDVKAGAVKAALGLDEAEPLMQQLGARAAQVLAALPRHADATATTPPAAVGLIVAESVDGDQWEIVLPWAVASLGRVILSQRVIDVIDRPRWL
jgi:hypothetical protein